MEDFIKKYKHFANQMLVCSIICWIGTLCFFLFIPNNKLIVSILYHVVPLGAIIFTIIYINCRINIKKYEKISKK